MRWCVIYMKRQILISKMSMSKWISYQIMKRHVNWEQYKSGSTVLFVIHCNMHVILLESVRSWAIVVSIERSIEYYCVPIISPVCVLCSGKICYDFLQLDMTINGHRRILISVCRTQMHVSSLKEKLKEHYIDHNNYNPALVKSVSECNY